MRTLSGIVLAALAASACNSDTDDLVESMPPEREACIQMCGLLDCEGHVSPDQLDACIDTCVDVWAQAQAQGPQCESGYRLSVECLGDLECHEFLAWNEGTVMVCESPLESFDQHCEDLEFDFRPRDRS